MALACIGLVWFPFFGYSSGGSAKQPTSNDQLQQRVQASIQRASPAVVYINDHATGTIISEDGLILSQAHVTHRAPAEREDGDIVQVVLADGKKTTAKLVAYDRGADVSLAKMEGPGPFPYLELSKRAPKLGDYTVKLGHPGRLHPLRGQVARLGRVVSTEPNHVVTDCLSIGGDSGGPFIDLDGKLLGMVADSVGLLQGSDVPYELASAVAASRLTTMITTADTISKHQGTVAGPLAMTLTTAADLVPIVERLQKEGSRSSPPNRNMPQVISRVGHWPEMKVSSRILPQCDWMNGPRHVHAITQPVRSMLTTEKRVVEFHQDGKLTKLGFFIDDKHVLTRATLPLGEGSGFVGGKTRTAIDLAVVGTSEALDLMLLKTETPTNHTAIDWLSEAPSTGTLLATPTTVGEFWTIGIVSVALRTPQSVHVSSGHKVFYDSSCEPDATFPTYFDTDLHLYLHETGQPVFDMNGRCTGIAIRSSHIGTRVIPAKAIQTWLETID